MRESSVWDNEQETTELLQIGWLAGLIDADGSIVLQAVKSKPKHKKTSTYTYHVRITIYNSDEGLIATIQEIFDKFGIKHYTQKRISRNPRNNEICKPNYQINVTEANSTKLLLELIVNLLQTHKKNRAKLCLRFLNIRLNRDEYYGTSLQATDIINQYLKLVGSSTTVCRTEKGTLEIISEETV